jgi:DNA-binding transcriptional ArsR family regulator
MNVSSEQYSYDIATAGVNEVRGDGDFAYAILGGARLTLSVDNGRIRLPLASVQGPCPDCALPENQTLTAGGDITLASLERSGNAQLKANLDGSLTEARLDERAIDPATLFGAKVATGAIAAAALGFLAFKLLGLLFTKWQDHDLLDHPRRRLVYQTIAEHPGTGFRELTRLTGLAIGTVRHHLDVLLRHGRIVERQQGASLRFFENHGKYDRTWSRVAVLRDEPTRLIHDWLAEHPDTPQNQLLAAIEERGFSKTATQRRLQRLVTAGLASVQQRGRFKVYRAI